VQFAECEDFEVCDDFLVDGHWGGSYGRCTLI
jgi:hypothetical protein